MKKSSENYLRLEGILLMTCDESRGHSARDGRAGDGPSWSLRRVYKIDKRGGDVRWSRMLGFSWLLRESGKDMMEMSPNGWLFVIAASVGTGLWVLSWEVLRGRKEGSLQKNKFQSKCFICNLNYSRGFPSLNFSLPNWANVSLWAFCYLDQLSNLSSSRHQQNNTSSNPPRKNRLWK